MESFISMNEAPSQKIKDAYCVTAHHYGKLIEVGCGGTHMAQFLALIWRERQYTDVSIWQRDGKKKMLRWIEMPH